MEKLVWKYSSYNLHWYAFSGDHKFHAEKYLNFYVLKHNGHHVAKFKKIKSAKAVAQLIYEG